MSIVFESDIKYTEFFAPLEKLFSEISEWTLKNKREISIVEIVITKSDIVPNWYAKIFYFGSDNVRG